MTDLDAYSTCFQQSWVGLRNQRVEYEKRMEAVKKYAGSRGYDRDVAEAEKKYRDGIRAIQDDARDKLNAILGRMRAKVAPVTMDAPTDAHIRILAALGMREHLTNDDVKLAAVALRDSETAMGVLADLAMRSGSVMPSGYKSAEAQRRDAVDALTSAANGLCFWDGSDSDHVRSEWSLNRDPYNPDADPSKVNPHTWRTARVAEMGGDDMQGMTYARTTYELCRGLIDDDIPWDVVRDLE